jgi:hypothetical protein
VQGLLYLFYSITTLPVAQGPEIKKSDLRELGTSKEKIIESQLTLKNLNAS